MNRKNTEDILIHNQMEIPKQAQIYNQRPIPLRTEQGTPHRTTQRRRKAHPATTDQPTTEGRGACPDVKKADQYPAAATPEDGAGNHPPDDTPATEGVPKATTGQPARPDNHISPQSFYGTGLSRKTCTIDWDYWHEVARS